MPLMNQAAFGELELQMKIQRVQNLGAGHAQRVMPIRRQTQQTVADAGVGQRGFHFGFDVFFTVRTKIPVQDMFCHFRVEVLRNVFHDARTNALLSVTTPNGRF